ncbi:hypothetical protein COY62_04420 [bacterium (Candidatus Howlettbacteria) CG_4_10_14_0_8_um_filter_40_9]|nr:MAG: hypothetical protein COY62_04420 [bacterium (Candidatus Howlettbacteria) CG_4_10_14_0_8_um_filter_40_9]
MFTIFLRTIRDRKTSILIYSGAAVGFLWMYTGIFPSFSESFEQIEKLIQTMPKGFMEAFGIDPASFTTFEGFISSEMFTFIWPIMLILLMVSFASGAIAGEIEKGTIELLLSQPISRLELFIAKYLSGIAALAAFVILSIGAVFPIASFYGIQVKSENFFRFGLLAFAFGFAVFSIAIFFSAILSEKGRANFIPAAVLILMYFGNILGGLRENLRDIRYGSFFYYFQPNKVLVHGEIIDYAWIVFLGTGIIFSILSVIWFSKRDIAV